MSFLELAVSRILGQAILAAPVEKEKLRRYSRQGV